MGQVRQALADCTTVELGVVSGEDSIDCNGFNVTQAGGALVLVKQGEGQHALFNSQAVWFTIVSIDGDNVIIAGDHAALFATGKEVCPKGGNGNYPATVQAPGASYSVGDDETTIPCNTGRITNADDSVCVRVQFVVTDNLDTSDGGVLHVKLAPYEHKTLTADTVLAAVLREDGDGGFTLQGDVTAKYPNGMHFDVAGTANDGANDGIYRCYADAELVGGNTSVWCQRWRAGESFVENGFFDMATAADPEAVTATAAAWNPYLLVGDAENDFDDVLLLSGSATCVSVSCNLYKSTKAAGDNTGHAVSILIDHPSLIVLFDGDTQATGAMACCFNPDVTIIRVVGDQTSDGDNGSCLGVWGTLLAVDGNQYASGGGVCVSTHGGYGAGVIGSLVGNQAADGEGSKIIDMQGGNLIISGEGTCTNGASAGIVQTDYDWTGNPSYLSGTYAFSGGDLTNKCTIEAALTVTDCELKNYGTIIGDITGSTTGAGTILWNVNETEFGISGPRIDGDVTLSGSSDSTLFQNQGVVIGDVALTASYAEASGMVNMGVVVGMISGTAESGTLVDGNGLNYPALPEAMVEIANVVSAEYVVIGHDNYTGGAEGTYPTTEDSQQAQYEIDQTAVQAVKASINNDVAPLTVQGEQDLDAIKAERYNAGYEAGEENGTIIL